MQPDLIAVPLPLPPPPYLQVAAGEADPAQLQAEEQRLGVLQQQLGRLQADFNSTAKQAAGVLSFLGFGKQAASSSDADTPSGRSRGAAASVSSQDEPLRVRKSGGGNSLWKALANQLLDLEAKLAVQASATEKQARELRRLKEQVRCRLDVSRGGEGGMLWCRAWKCGS